MKSLSEKEIKKFTLKYLPEWLGEIHKVTLITYKGVKEYLVNDHYLVIDKIFKVEKKDLQ